MSDCGIGTTFPIGFGPIPDALSGGSVKFPPGTEVVCEVRAAGSSADIRAGTAGVNEDEETLWAEFSDEQTALFTPVTYIGDGYANHPDGRRIALCKPFSFKAVKMVSTTP